MKHLLGMALILGLAGSAVWAHDDKEEEGKGREHHEMSMEKMQEKLGLSKDQAEKFAAAKKVMEESNKPMHEEMAAEMARLGQQLKNKADDKAIQATLDKLEKNHKAMDAAHEKFKAEMESVLTPTQRARMLMGMMERMHGGWKGRGEGMRGGPHKHDDDDGENESQEPAEKPSK